MKKLLISLVCALTAVICALPFAACGKGAPVKVKDIERGEVGVGGNYKISRLRRVAFIFIAELGRAVEIRVNKVQCYSLNNYI